MKLCLVFLLVTNLFQGPPNSRASITSDYRQVTLVAHVRLDKVEQVEKIGGYLIYRVRAQVLELFKGKFPTDSHLTYYMQVEEGIDMTRYTGEKIVFVEFHNNDEATEYRTLENSDREPTKKILALLRNLKRSQKPASAKQ